MQNMFLLIAYNKTSLTIIIYHYVFCFLSLCFQPNGKQSAAFLGLCASNEAYY